MSVVLALSKSAASFSIRAPRFGGAAARLMSVKGGSIPESESEKVLYSLGINIARQVGSELKPQLTKEEINTVIQGFTDSMADNISDELGMLQKYGPKINELLIGRQKRAGDAEKTKGLNFITKYLEANPTAVNTASGLVYHETVPGIGAQPTADSTVEVHYHGTTVDGTVFDSSVQRGETIKFPLKNVIAGWQEGVAMMKVGGKATLVCPSEIAYGESGSPPVILPGATLVFEVELINVL